MEKTDKAVANVSKSTLDPMGATDPKSPIGPFDKHRLVYWSTFFVGLVILLPWNILITVSGYWDYKFRNVTLDGNDFADGVVPPPTNLQKEFASYLSIAANVPNAAFVILHALFGHKFSMSRRIISSQIGLIAVFAGTLILAILNSDSWQKEFLIANLVTIVFINVFSAIFQGSFMANLGTFPVSYIGSSINGAGMGGLLPSVVNVIILAANSNFQMAGFWCFLFAEILALVCLALTIYLHRKNVFYRYFSSLDRPQTSVFSYKDDLQAYADIFKDAWIFLLVTLINFTVTLVIFPAVTVLIEPKNPVPGDWHDVFFVPVGCFVVYNFFDYVGKTLASWIQWPRISLKSQIALLVAVVARMAFIPLFMFCNVSPLDRNTKVVFESEIYYFVFMVVFAASNGYIGNIALMFGPKVVKPKYQEMTAAFLLAALVVGCGIGSIISTPVVKLL